MLQITVTISDADELALRNDLLDIDKWVQDAVRGKINNCKSRMVRPDGKHIQKLFADPTVESIPANQDALIALITSRPDYKDRTAREAEALATKEAALIAASGNDIIEETPV